MATLELGAVTRRVAANIQTLRKQRRIGLRQLSRDLAEHGRPIIPSSLTRAEAGQRRIDVDDLIALAVTLDTTPNRLLLGPDADDSPVELTSKVTVSAWTAWRWAVGEDYLRGAGETFDLDRVGRASRESRPHDPSREASLTVEELGRVRAEHTEEFEQLANAIGGLLDAGIPAPDLRALISVMLMGAQWLADREGS